MKAVITPSFLLLFIFTFQVKIGIAQTFLKTLDSIYTHFSAMQPQSLFEASNGQVVIVGQRKDNTEGNLLLVSGTTGDILNDGRTRIQAPKNEAFQQIVEAVEGTSGSGYCLIGNTGTSKIVRDGWLIRVDENGNRINPNANDPTFGNATTDDFFEKIVATDTAYWIVGHQGKNSVYLLPFTDKLGNLEKLSDPKIGTVLSLRADLMQDTLLLAGSTQPESLAFRTTFPKLPNRSFLALGNTKEQGRLCAIDMLSPTSLRVFSLKDEAIFTSIFDTEKGNWENTRQITLNYLQDIRKVVRLSNGKYLLLVIAPTKKNGPLRNRLLLINPLKDNTLDMDLDLGDDYRQSLVALAVGFENRIWIVGNGINAEKKAGVRLIKLDMQTDRAAISTDKIQDQASAKEWTAKGSTSNEATQLPALNCPKSITIDQNNRPLSPNETRKISFSINSATDIAVEFISKTSGISVPAGQRWFKTNGSEVTVSLQATTTSLSGATATIQATIKAQGTVLTCTLELPCNTPLSKNDARLKTNYNNAQLNKGKPMLIDTSATIIKGQVGHRPLPPGTQLVVEVPNNKKDEQVKVSNSQQDHNGDTYSEFAVALKNLKDNDNIVILKFQTPDGKDIRIDTLHIFCSLRRMNMHIVTIAPPSNLTHNIKDSREIAQILQNQMRFDTSKRLYNAVFTHQFDTKENTTRDELFRLFDELPKRLNETAPLFPKDILIVFMSSHGKIVEEQNCNGIIEKRFKIIPSNAQNNDKITLDFERDMSAKLSNLGCKTLVLLDACHSGGAKAANDEDLLRVLNDLNNTPSGMVILSSSKAIQESFESKELQNGAFTRALLEALGHYPAVRTVDTNGNNWLSLDELWQYVAQRVPEIVQPKDAKGKTLNLPIERIQTPHISRRDFDLSKEFFRLR